ncbi:hypothetical protein GCM10010394_47180 [Streptomyces crystallinus]|uniref:Uncharacterized protein n=1 Tax=Streptomyces crystallinus TaxID=68191 RepID=A0ABP3RK33_9ACTN
MVQRAQADRRGGAPGEDAGSNPVRQGARTTTSLNGAANHLRLVSQWGVLLTGA